MYTDGGRYYLAKDGVVESSVAADFVRNKQSDNDNERRRHIVPSPSLSEGTQSSRILTVIEPVGDGRNCGAALEDILVRTQNHCCHIATISPAMREELLYTSHHIKCVFVIV